MKRGATLTLALVALACARAETPPVHQVSARLAETRARAASQIRGYTVLRRYSLSTGRGGHSAEMTVRLTYTWPRQKKFEILSERGSNTITKRVFHRLLKAEEDVSCDTRLTPNNYAFQMEGVETLEGRRCYVLRLTPRTSEKYLVRGRAWVDASDFAIVKVEGEPVDTDSFWIKSSHVVQRYRKVGGFWLPAVNESESEVRLFGQAHLTIENFDYKINAAETEDRAGLVRRTEVE